jgi:hypothetical protein
MQKVGMVGETREEMVGMELMWRHGMGTGTFYSFSNFSLFLKCSMI